MMLSIKKGIYKKQKKHIIIALVIIFLIFGVIMTIIIINRPKNEIEEESPQHFARNTTKQVTETTETSSTQESKEADISIETAERINNLYINSDLLSEGELKHEETMYKTIKNLHRKKNITDANEANVFVHVEFEVEKPVDYVFCYDYNRGKYYQYMTQEEYDYLTSDEFSAGQPYRQED